MEESERLARQEIGQLAFRYKRFNEQSIHQFANLNGYLAALILMKECVAENASREAKKLMPQNEGALFRSKVRGYKKDRKDEQQKHEWRSHVEKVYAETQAGFNATDEQVEKGLADYLDKGECSQAQYNIGLRFMRSLQGDPIPPPAAEVAAESDIPF